MTAQPMTPAQRTAAVRLRLTWPTRVAAVQAALATAPAMSPDTRAHAVRVLQGGGQRG